MDLSKKINTFLEKGNNKRIVKIIDAVLIAALSIATLYFVVMILNIKTEDGYATKVLSNLLFVVIFGIIDVALILFTKPLFGFTSVFENYRANKIIKTAEKQAKKAAEADAKERIKKACLEAKAKKAEGKAK